MRSFVPANLVLEPTLNLFSLDNDTPTKSIFTFEDLIRTPTTPLLGVSHFKMSEAFNIGAEADVPHSMQPPVLSSDNESEPQTDEEMSRPPSTLDTIDNEQHERFAYNDLPSEESIPYPVVPTCSFSHPRADEWLTDVLANGNDTTDYSGMMNSMIQDYQPATVCETHHTTVSPGEVGPAPVGFSNVYFNNNVGTLESMPQRQTYTPKKISKAQFRSPPIPKYKMTAMDLAIPLAPITPEEVTSREEAQERLKKALQSVKLTDFQVQYISNESTRMDPLMAARNKKACKECKVVFSTAGRYAFHYEDHGCKKNTNGAPREFCEVENCPYKVIGFSCRQSYSRHKTSVHEGMRFICKNCDRVFARRDGLRRHSLTRCCLGEKKKAAREATKTRKFRTEL